MCAETSTHTVSECVGTPHGFLKQDEVPLRETSPVRSCRRPVVVKDAEVKQLPVI